MATTEKLDTRTNRTPEEIGRAARASAVRELNDELAGVGKGSVTPVRLIACECGQSDCDLTIEVAIATYQAARMEASRFLVAKRHRFAGPWDVVASTREYSIVEPLDTRPTNGALGRLLRVLIADDDPSLRKLYAVELQLAGVAVLEAADGRQALDRARFHRPDLVVTDVMMPRMDGFELAAALRRDERTRKIPIVFISSVPEDDGGARARSLGALAYLAKASDPEAMTNVIVELLARKRRVDRFLAQVLEARKSTPSLSKAMPYS